MMREIGSEFWDIPLTQTDNALFPKSTQWFLSGRSALQAILKELNHCHTVAMPSWCCDSMVKPFIDAGLKVRFYPVTFNANLVQCVNLECDVLFLMDYFGYTGAQPDLKGYNGVIIRDVTHSLFSNDYSDADYYFGSLRKWGGFWTGGYAWTKDGHQFKTLKKENFTKDHGYIALREKAMQSKCEYINARGGADKSYLAIFNEAEDVLETIDIVPAADRDVNAALKLNVAFIKMRRRKNAEILRGAFPDWLVFPELKDSDCPMFVPVLVPDGKRNELRRFLIKNEIYCPVHWPVSEYHKLDERTEKIYTDELSLVCDQRYTEEDMNRMVSIIKAFFKEG